MTREPSPDAGSAADSAVDSALHTALDPALLAALDAFAARERVLVALDFDGTLAPEVDDPESARALPAAHEALLRLRARPGTTVALVSGRALESLAAVGALPDDAPLVGSHGLEVRFAAGDAPPAIDDTDRARVVALRSRLEPIVVATEGAWIEHKPAGFAVHLRLVEPALASRLAAAVRSTACEVDPGLTVRDGKNVVEFSVRDATKGDGLRALRERFAPDAVLFAGDDVTDEDALAVLGPDDVGIKVGAAATVAPHRVDGPAAMALVLQHLATRRSAC
ncbi:trehalose-phosphatase [Microcella sp.]|uniref:trehalose-phosphatase n=1 Tax=Microcella sp. TaxID=1913979 RepID=UPI003919A086